MNITDNLDSSRSQAFDYDALYRLTDASGIYGDIAYTYDKVGNRLTRTDSQGTDIYDYLSGTNKLRTVSGPNAKSYSYDMDGNVIAALGGQQPSLADRADYTYNSNGQRVEKVADGQTVVKHFDLGGQLIAETDDTGNLVRAYVWLHGQPLAQIDAGGTVYYYHNDHLGTPQGMTDSSGSVVWAADYLPFGQVDVTVESVENDLRFAGQYYDSETGLHYNYHRYYDPQLGRYLRADPLGHGGGVNPYIFALNNPMKYTDPLGLLSCIGNWRRKDWTYVVPIIFRKCICYWVCESCDGSYIWDGNLSGLPTTIGNVIYQGGEGLEEGDNCMCKFPGPQKGCDECPPPLYSTDFPFSDVG